MVLSKRASHSTFYAIHFCHKEKTYTTLFFVFTVCIYTALELSNEKKKKTQTQNKEDRRKGKKAKKDKLQRSEVGLELRYLRPCKSPMSVEEDRTLN